MPTLDRRTARGLRGVQQRADLMVDQGLLRANRIPLCHSLQHDGSPRLCHRSDLVNLYAEPRVQLKADHPVLDVAAVEVRLQESHVDGERSDERERADGEQQVHSAGQLVHEGTDDLPDDAHVES